MAGYIGTTPVPQATQHRESFTATGGQTSFATAGYTPQFIDVYLNGVKLAPADYTATNGSDVVLASGATASDILEIVAYTPFEVANQTFTGTTTAANLTVTGAFTSQGIDDNADAVAITIDSSENVGIGTSSPSSLLTLHGSQPIITLSDPDTGSTSTISGNSGHLILSADSGNNASNNTIDFQIDNSQKMRIDSSGNLLVGATSSVSGTLVVDGNSANNLWLIGRDSDGTSSLSFRNNADSAYNARLEAVSSNLIIETGGSERMRIDSNGNLLVGKTATGFGTSGIELRADNTLFVTRSNNTPAYINRLTADGNIVEFAKDGTTVGLIASNGGAMTIGSGDVGVYYDAGSDRILPMNASTNAVRDAAIDIGASSYRFKDLYLSGGVYLGGTGSANKLDDYEEGDFAPTYSIASGSITTTTNAGRYVKIGQLVFFTFRIRSSAASGTGVLTMTLPFATAAENRAGGSQGFARDWGSDMPNFRFYVQPSSSIMIFYKNAMNTGSTQVTGSDVDTGSDNNVLEGSIVYKSAT